jgi:hypothetical protein
MNASHWIVTADSRRARLFSCTRSSLPESPIRLHIEEVRTLENDQRDEHEHHRPALLGGAERSGSIRRSGARAAPHAATVGHDAEEQHRRFAQKIAHWIGTAQELLAPGQQNAREVTVFAPARMCGLLRDQFMAVHTPLPHQTKLPHIRVHAAELAGLGPPELAVHPAVAEAALMSTSLSAT